MFVNIVSNFLRTWFMPYGYALVFRQYGTQTPYFCRSKKFSKFVELVQYVIEERKDLEDFTMYIWTLWYCRNLLFIVCTNPFLLIKWSQWPNKLFLILLVPSQSNCLCPLLQIQIGFVGLLHNVLQPKSILMVQCLRRREAGIVVVVQTNQELVLASKAEMLTLPIWLLM